MSHEFQGQIKLPWEVDASVLATATDMIIAYPGRLVGDVGFYYLPYVGLLLKMFPDARFICLKRNRDATVRSYMAKTPGKNRWSAPAHRGQVASDEWDKCYPKYDLPKEQAIGQYWEDYYETAERLQRRHPANFRIWRMAALNSVDGQADLLGFAGVPKSQFQLCVGIRRNVLASRGGDRKRRRDIKKGQDRMTERRHGVPRKLLIVLGANGLLGSTLHRVAERDHTVDAPDRSRLDLSDANALLSWEPRADWVVNCAAVTDVDACEEAGALQSLLVNAVAPELLAAACRRVGVGFIHVSTDYVFYGDGLGSGEDGQYDETDETGPRNRYGLHKLMGEFGARQHGGYVLRTAWLYGPSGKNFVSKAYDLALARKPLAVDDASSSTPTLASNLAKYILAIVEKGEKRSGALYHCCDAGEFTRWEVFDRVRKELGCTPAEWLVERGGLYAAGPAVRPARTPLDSSAFFMRFGVAQATVKASVAEFVAQCREAGPRVVSGEVVV